MYFRKGVIFSKDPDTVAYTQTLNNPEGNFDEPNDYIIITNFDFFFHDFREYFDPTGGQVLLISYITFLIMLFINILLRLS